ncbi:hypothetical protein GCM10012287_46340 [Streptomyces daqingensis]|uniref:Uncharacterized protein n=1 Tax=Streptomyces daqingensis TaxID=1472640 RepID=A0ABQ2MNW3_9ACTN|nr:hypothetical protein [Streptomyces daqingensis]GGO55321.1 hypothetical protein GCM10012287_46340 [Streptomyces daqingensis]
MAHTESERCSTATQKQSEYFYVLTVQKPVDRGFAVQTSHGTATLPDGVSRQDAFTWAMEEMCNHRPEMRGGNVTFFSLEPNRL